MAAKNYTQEEKEKILKAICKRIAEGEAVRQILPTKGRARGLNTRDAFYSWIKADKDLADQYARASRDRAEKIFDEILRIADEPDEIIEEETTVIKNKAGAVVQHITKTKKIDRTNHRRMRIDARKWALGKMHPEKYSEKFQAPEQDNPEQPLFPDE